MEQQVRHLKNLSELAEFWSVGTELTHFVPQLQAKHSVALILRTLKRASLKKIRTNHRELFYTSSES